MNVIDLMAIVARLIADPGCMEFRIPLDDPHLLSGASREELQRVCCLMFVQVPFYLEFLGAGGMLL